MTGSNVGPYRATALWNEAVIMFRDYMPLQEHRHRLHKHRNSFSGHDAVSFFHQALQTNPLFNPDVTREQACQLLKQFLKSDLITPVQNCSVGNNKIVFRDSYKHLYEFTEKLQNFKRLTPLFTKFNSEPKSDNSSNDSQKENALNTNAEKSWKWAVIKRIIELLKPFDASELANVKEINPKWVATNADPEWNKIKWNTELPNWILSTMQQLLKYSSKDFRGNAYPSFQMDAFKVICDYFKTLENPVILQCFYKIYIEIFNYLDYLNKFESSSFREIKMSGSQEDLMFKISSPVKQALKKNMILSNNNLPPNHCYEAAFISDDPTFRVVPQSSVDTVHFQKGHSLESKEDNHICKNTCMPIKNFNVEEKNEKNCLSKSRKVPLKSVENLKSPHKSLNNLKSGIINEGFALFSPKNLQNKENCIKYRSCDYLNAQRFSNEFDESSTKELSSSHSCYINHGLSFSLEDINLLANDHLDYNYALESLDKLMKVTQYNASTSDDDYSFHSALSSLEADLNDEIFQDSPKSFEVPWKDHIRLLGVNILQLLLMLLPPCNRAQLKNLSLLMSEVSESSASLGFSLQNMVQEMSWTILRPHINEPYNPTIANRLLSFIVTNHLEIFTDLSPELFSVITNEMYERQLQVFTYCKQITEKQFELQKTEESNIALNQLLDHIISNTAISEKERKKHLKVFKASYPTIYKDRFPSEFSSSKSKMLFSFTNFRL